VPVISITGLKSQSSTREWTEAMVQVRHVPRSPLSEFVESMWLGEGEAPAHRRERVLPNGAVQLVVNVRDRPLRVYDRVQPDRPLSLSPAVVCGARSEHVVIDSRQLGSVMTVSFRPGGAAPFLGLPAGELRNAQVPLESIWGPAAVELHHRLLDATAPATRFRIVEEALLARAASRMEKHPVVTYALSQLLPGPRAASIGDVTRAVGLNPRRFIQVFLEQVGLTPKVFCRVRRFQQALGRARAGRPVEWAEVALACDYFDQAHFNRDFRAFAGLSPSAYLLHCREFQNHVPLLD
jgi:AraC-like DNA-binding protein